MPEHAPRIADFMTVLSTTLDADRPLVEADRLMKLNYMDHLPIVRQGSIIGVVLNQDVATALNVLGEKGARTPVRQITIREVYLVRPDSKLNEVIETMTRYDLQTVLVIHHHRLIGIFTKTNAIRALKSLMVPQI